MTITYSRNESGFLVKAPFDLKDAPTGVARAITPADLPPKNIKILQKWIKDGLREERISPPVANTSTEAVLISTQNGGLIVKIFAGSALISTAGLAKNERQAPEVFEELRKATELPTNPPVLPWIISSTIIENAAVMKWLDEFWTALAVAFATPPLEKGRGGARNGAGRKPAEVKPIRTTILIAPDLLAHVKEKGNVSAYIAHLIEKDKDHI